MRFTTLAVTAAAALTTTTSALLIPPSHVLHPVQKNQPASSPKKAELHPIYKTRPISPSEREHDIARLFDLPSPWKIDLECPGCDWAGPFEKDVETFLEITIEADKESGLLINDVAAMQPDPTRQGLVQPQAISLFAKQRRLDTGETTTPMPLDFVMERLDPVHGRSHHGERGVRITPVRLTIVGFAGKPVKVDTLAIDVVESTNGRRVGRVTRIPFAITPGAFSCEGETAWSYCRVQAIIRSRILNIIKTMKDRGRHAKAWAAQGCSRGMKFRHGHHSHAHKWAKMLHSTLRFLVIPALLGIIGGLLASAIGMVVGQMVVFLWRRFGSDRRCRSSHHGRVVEIIVTEDEKDRLLLESEEKLPSPPPRYEDLEAGEVEYEDEKQQAVA